MYSTSALKQDRVDATIAYFSNDGGNSYACPVVQKLQDFYGRQMDTPLQWYGYGDTQRNIACIDNSLVTDIKDVQRRFAVMQTSPPFAYKQTDEKTKVIGGGFRGTNIGNMYEDPLGTLRNYSMGDRPIYQAVTKARTGVSPDHEWMDNNGKIVQQKTTPVYFLRM